MFIETFSPGTHMIQESELSLLQGTEPVSLKGGAVANCTVQSLRIYPSWGTTFVALLWQWRPFFHEKSQCCAFFFLKICKNYRIVAYYVGIHISVVRF